LGYTVYAFNHKSNHRDGPDQIKARNNTFAKAASIDDEYLHHDGEFHRMYLGMPDTVIVVDEGQFFGENLKKLAIMARQRTAEFDLIVAGLLLDSDNLLFGPMGDLRAIANKTTDLTAWCQACGSVARFTYSSIPKDGQVRVGDEGFEPSCERCWIQREADKAAGLYTLQ
jgi:thymidine kinase